MTAQPVLNSFQSNADRALHAVADEFGLPVRNRQVHETVAPVYDENPQVYVTAEIREVKVWLYDDGVSFEGPKGTEDFERLDYDSENEILQVFVDRLRQALQAER